MFRYLAKSIINEFIVYHCTHSPRTGPFFFLPTYDRHLLCIQKCTPGLCHVRLAPPPSAGRCDGSTLFFYAYIFCTRRLAASTSDYRTAALSTTRSRSERKPHLPRDSYPLTLLPSGDANFLRNNRDRSAWVGGHPPTILSYQKLLQPYKRVSGESSCIASLA